MNTNLNLWIIRAYASIIIIVLLGGFLEGVAAYLVAVMAAILIIVWTFLIKIKK